VNNLSKYLEYMVVWEHHIKCLGNDGLQGQQISAQGNALGNDKRQMYNSPCKGKRTNMLYFAFALVGRVFPSPFKPQGVALG